MATPIPKAETFLSRHWNQIARLAARGDMDEALPAIVRLPDRLADHGQAPDVDYRLLAVYFSGLSAVDPVERTVAGLLEAHCLYRAGDTLPAQQRFAEAVRESGAIDDPERASCLGAMAACGEALARMRGGDRQAAVRLGRAAVRKSQGLNCDWLCAYAQHSLGRILAVEPRHRARARAILQQAADAYRSPTVKDLRGEAYVLHIKAGNRKPGTTEPTTLGDEQGELVVHNL